MEVRVVLHLTGELPNHEGGGVVSPTPHRACGSPSCPFHSIFNFYYTHDTHFSRDRTRTSLGLRAPPLASSFDLFSRRPHQQPQIPTCGLDCTFSKRSAWRYTHPTRSSLYILSRAEREALPTPRGIPRGKAERTRSRLAACSAWRICPQLDTFDRSWAVDTTSRRSR